MLLAIKIIGGFCTVAIPTGIFGVQTLLSKNQQEAEKKAIEAEVKEIQKSLEDAYKNYQVQIERIRDEKNALLTTKTALTYIPVEIKDNIDKLNTAKSTYETSHTKTQESINEAITEHTQKLEKAKSAIEALWTAESARLKDIQTKLETAINSARDKNKELINSIDQLKDQIETTINGVFMPKP